MAETTVFPERVVRHENTVTVERAVDRETTVKEERISKHTHRGWTVPVEFEAAWEYFVPSEEMLEAFGDQERSPKISDLFDPRDKERAGQGFVFGRGDPNYYRSHIGPEKPCRVREYRHQERHCKQCFRKFHPLRPTTAYCSKTCAGAARRNGLYEERPCLECGRLFRPRKSTSRCCSTSCAGRYRGRKRPCLHCGRVFHPQRKEVLHCSKSCTTKTRWAMQPETFRSAKPAERQKLSCQHCGKLFPRKDADSRFCSIPCRIDARSLAKRLPDSKIALILELYSQGVKIRDIVSQANVSRPSVSRVVRKAGVQNRHPINSKGKS